jgi:hypothetical protein
VGHSGIAEEIMDAALPITGVPLFSGEREVARLDFAGVDSSFPAAPVSGQGMNTGIQDTYNLAWKLRLALDPTGPNCSSRTTPSAAPWRWPP